MPYIPVVTQSVRDGEITLVKVATNQISSRIDVYSDIAGYNVLIDGRETGDLTEDATGVVSVDVGEGGHIVELTPTGGVQRWIAPKSVKAPRTDRVSVKFTVTDITGGMGKGNISAVDIHDNTLSNFTVYVNGRLMSANDIEPGTKCGQGNDRTGQTGQYDDSCRNTVCFWLRL